MKYKWCAAVCKCGAVLPPVIQETSAPEPWISIYPCWECAHPEEVAAERRAWEVADRKVMEMAERGEILDAQGNAVPAMRFIQ